MADRALFASKMEAWNASQDLPWNCLRYTLVHENLTRHLGAPPRRIFDAGGGDGRDAVPLACLGHRVTLVDFVPEMVEGAQRSAAEVGVGERMNVILGDIAAVSGELAAAGAQFDAVICHNVLQYAANPQALLCHLAGLLAPGGLLSLLTPNPLAESYRLALQQLDFAAALAALEATSYTNALYGAEVRLFTLEELETMLMAAGVDAVVHYGVRCIMDYIQDNSLKHDPERYCQILALERELGRRMPYRELARFRQVIARRAPGC